MTPALPLLPHQQAAVEWIRRETRGLLGDEPGLGKSRVAIEAFDGGRVLVVAPALIVSSGTWGDEIARWARHPEGFTVAPYSMLNARVKTAKGGTTPIDLPRPEYMGPWDALVVDEAHYTKGRKTSWTAAVDSIASRSGAVLQMTGTPIPNWAYELFTLLKVLRPHEAGRGQRLGSYWRWALEWFNNEPTVYSRYNLTTLKACVPECADRPPHDPCAHYRAFMAANLGSQFLRRLRDDVLTDLPPLTEQQILTEMSASAKTAYRRLKKEYIAQIGVGDVKVAWSSGERNVMLDQLTVSPWMLDPQGEPTGGKFDRLTFDLESRSRPTLVFAHYRSVVEAAARVAQGTGAKTAYVHGGVPDAQAAEAVRAFKEGRLDVLVGSLSMLSEGLTLTAADQVIFVEKSWRPSLNLQAMRRVHRIGQTRPVTVLDYVTPDSLDARKREALQAKTDHQIAALTAAEMKEML